MERAGAGLAAITMQLAPAGPIAVVCGKGNNGGDGFVAARLLRELGARSTCCTVAPVERVARATPATNLERLPGATPRAVQRRRARGRRRDRRCDARHRLLRRAARRRSRRSIDAINAAERRRRGRLRRPQRRRRLDRRGRRRAVRADATATFHAAKPGLWIAPGKAHAGEVEVVDIGIPSGGPGEPTLGLIERSVLAEVPRRGRGLDQVRRRQRAGLRRLARADRRAVPGRRGGDARRRRLRHRVHPGLAATRLRARLLEVMTVPLPDEDGALMRRRGRPRARARRTGAARSCSAPGWAATGERRASRARSPAGPRSPLRARRRRPERVRGTRSSAWPAARRPTVLTPHAGELGRLLEPDATEIERPASGARSASAAERGAGRSSCSRATTRSSPRPTAAWRSAAAAPRRSPPPAPATCSPGVIGAYLAKRMDPFHAACAGVFVHARAGRLAAARIGGARA